jgi:hypothetical protein
MATQLVDRDMRSQVVDPVDRLVEPEGERLGRRHPDQQGTREARSRGDGDRVDVVELDARLLAGPLDRRHHRLQVRPAGDLRHDPAEPGMLLDAARHRVCQERVPAHHPDPRLIARRLDPEH